MSPLRVLVCDDEPLAARRLTSMLGDMPGVLVVATAANGAEALQGVADADPDLLLLDIEMPGADGFDVVERLYERGRPPLVAFVTAHRSFAPDAFDTGVIDFLSKPVRRPRLEKMLGRAREALIARNAEARLAALQLHLAAVRERHLSGRDDDIWVSKRGSLVRVELRKADRIVAEGSYVRIYVGGESYLHREAIGGIEARLDPTSFIRVHRSHLVRGQLVTAIRRTIHGGGELILSCGAVIPLGRKYASEARRRILAHPAA